MRKQVAQPPTQRKRRSDRHRAKQRTKRLSSRLGTVMISVFTSAMMLLGIAIYAESHTGSPDEPPQEAVSNVDAQPEAPEVPEAPQAPAPPEEEDNTASPEAPEEPTANPDEEPIVTTTEESTSEPPEEETPGPEPTEEPASTPPPAATEEPGASATPIPTMPPPTANPTITPTTAPTTEPTVEPTLAPSAYTLSITPPTGWYRDTAKVKLCVTDMNGTGWQYVQWRINGDGAWVDISHLFATSDYGEVEISEDCTVYLAVISPSGKTVTAEKYIHCFDREIPVVRAAIDGETLRAEGKDNHSGIAAIIVCGHRFTDLKDNVLRIRLRDYADNYEQITIQAEDKAGNLSEIKTLKNPYYDPRVPTPTPRPTCPPNTPTPTKAPVPTRTPRPGNSGGGGGGGNSKATPTPMPAETPDPNASPEPSETPYSFYVTPTEAPPTIEPGTGFSSTGNAIARDLLYDRHSNKQFIHMQTRDGASFYAVIDYDKPLDEAGDSYETFFLNAVDARDLFDLVDEEDLPERYQPTPEPLPTDIPMPTPEPTPVPPEPTSIPETDPEPEPEKSGGSAMMGILLLALAGGGAAVWYFKFKKPQGGKNKNNPFDDFDEEYDDDLDDGDGED